MCGLELGLKVIYVSIEVGGGWLGVDNILLIILRIFDFRVLIRVFCMFIFWIVLIDWVEKCNFMGMLKFDVKIWWI